MPHKVKLKAPAKLNLHLEVLRLREDGYHEIETVLQAISLYDLLTVTVSDKNSDNNDIAITVTPDKSAPADESNLCCKAASLFMKEAGVGGNVTIELQKQIPSEAGLGGGSSDAAAVLVACNKLFNTNYSNVDLEKMGCKLGADVPFFISGGTQLARGIGTDLTKLHQVSGCRFLIMKPRLNISTFEVYSSLNMGLTERPPLININNVKALLTRYPSESWLGFNRLEEVVVPRNTVLQEQLAELREREVLAMMTGSGSALFAAYTDNAPLREFAEEFLDDKWYVAEVTPISSGVELMEE